MKNEFRVLTVSQLNLYVRSQLESDPVLSNIFIRGEISNFTNHYRSGHLYMSLKDENAAIKAVMFRGNASRLRFAPQNGMKVIAMGRASVYERDGQYQFYIDDMQPDGIGALYTSFEQLKEKLGKEGLFDQSQKKTLPLFPEKIGVITSPTGAALQDIKNILLRRWPVASIILYPVLVQGVEAPKQICTALNYFNNPELPPKEKVNLVILGRGGGSMEELWAFNDESVARMIAASKIPVISAVGHETDYTLSDFAADLRAPTPSAAAELAVPDCSEVQKYIRSLLFTMRSQVIHNKISLYRNQLNSISSNRAFQNPLFIIEQYRMKLDKLVDSQNNAYLEYIQSSSQRLSLIAGKLDTLSPLKVLSRGYTIAKSQEGKAIESVTSLKLHDKITLQFHDGKSECTVESID